MPGRSRAAVSQRRSRRETELGRLGPVNPLPLDGRLAPGTAIPASSAARSARSFLRNARSPRENAASFSHGAPSFRAAASGFRAAASRSRPPEYSFSANPSSLFENPNPDPENRYQIRPNRYLFRPDPSTSPRGRTSFAKTGTHSPELLPVFTENLPRFHKHQTPSQNAPS